MSDVYRVADVRPLTLDERRLLEWLLHHGTAEAADYLEQLPNVSVVSHCSCGCPTIDLAVDGRAPSGPSTILGDGMALSPEGIRVGIVVHSRGGLISELEIFPYGDAGVFSLPRINDIETF